MHPAVLVWIAMILFLAIIAFRGRNEMLVYDDLVSRDVIVTGLEHHSGPARGGGSYWILYTADRPNGWQIKGEFKHGELEDAIETSRTLIRIPEKPVVSGVIAEVKVHDGDIYELSINEERYVRFRQKPAPGLWPTLFVLVLGAPVVAAAYHSAAVKRSAGTRKKN